MTLAIDGTPVSAVGVFGGNPANTVTMPNFTTTQTNNIVLLTVNNASTAITSVTGSTLGAFTKIGSSSGSSPPTHEVYAAFASAALTNEVVSIVLANNFDPSFTLFAVSGSNQTSLTGAFETFIGNENGAFSGTMPQNFTTTNANAMIIGAVATGFGAVPATPGTGFTFVDTPTGRLTTLYKVRSSIGTDSISTNEDNLAQAMVGFAVIGITPSSALLEDGAFWFDGSTPYVTDAFTTEDNSLLVVSFCGLSDAGTVDAVVTSSPSLTWTRRARSTHSASFPGFAEIWTAPVTTGASTTISIEDSGTAEVWNRSGGTSIGSMLNVASYVGYEFGTLSAIDDGTIGTEAPYDLALGGTSAADAIVHAIIGADADAGSTDPDEGSGWSVIQKDNAGSYTNGGSWFKSSTIYKEGALTDAEWSAVHAPYQYISAAVELVPAGGGPPSYTPYNPWPHRAPVMAQ